MYVIDFDGTIVDIWERYYKIFTDFWRLDFLSLDEFKKLKLRFPSDDDLIAYLVKYAKNSDTDNYKSFKRNNLESEKYLKFDSLIINDLTYKKLMNNNTMILTMRYNAESLYNQMRRFNLYEAIKKTNVLTPNGSETKMKWIKKNYANTTELINVVGDSETDLLIGKNDNVRVYIVATGLRDIDYLNKLNIKFSTIKNINCLKVV